MGSSAESLMGSDERPTVLEGGPPRIGLDGARVVDEAIQTQAGVRWLSWVETTIPGRGGAPELVRAGRDITERVAAERKLEEARVRAEAASEAKSRFLATVSHEFRTPLNGILGMADLLLDTAPTPEQTTYIRAVKTSGQALLSLIDEILDSRRSRPAGSISRPSPSTSARSSRAWSSFSRRRRRGRASRSPPLWPPTCRGASSATPTGCARSWSTSPATP
jgi:signal transduction histidine kinase